MVKIRLRRVGAKKQPHYRVVVADSRSPRDGKFIEVIGHYNPRTEPPTVQIDGERALYWLSVGAQPTAAIHRMLDRLGIMARFEAHKLGELPVEELEAEALAEAAEPEAKEEAEEAEEAELVEEAVPEEAEQDEDETGSEEDFADEDEDELDVDEDLDDEDELDVDEDLDNEDEVDLDEDFGDDEEDEKDDED